MLAVITRYNSATSCCRESDILIGIAVALALKAALVEFKISGKVSLLGTPGTCIPTLRCHSLINAIGILADITGIDQARKCDDGPSDHSPV